jgi:diaminopimelate decarboxylase
MLDRNFLLSLSRKFGTPLYVIDEDVLLDRVRYINKCFSTFPTQVMVAYPFKVNPLPKIIQLMIELDRWAEVASGMEIKLATQLGFKPQRIIFNAPYKTKEDLELAMELECKIHFDNFEEIKLFREISKSFKKKVDVGIRVSYPEAGKWSRFGFEFGNETSQAVQELTKIRNVNFIGLHGHQSNIVCLNEYRTFLQKLFDLAKSIQSDQEINLEYIDIGSGFSINYPRPINIHEWTPPDIKEYAKTAEELWVDNHFNGTIPNLIIEPGRSCVASSGSLLTKIVSLKQRGDENIAFTDSALNFLPGAEIYKYQINLLTRKEDNIKKGKKYVICGCLCDSLDIIDDNFQADIIHIEDVLQVLDVGGYDMARSFVWQLPLPKIAWVNTNGGVHIIDR